MGGGKMATIKDVAKLAGVNPSTVSRVIADNPKITNETKKRVYDAMKELHYRPNAIARSLASKSRTKIIGVILPSDSEALFHNPFFIRVISSISSYAQKHGYYIMHGHSGKEEGEMKILKDLVNSRWVDGIILTTTREHDKCIEYLNDVNMPFVVIGKVDEDVNAYTVDNDNTEATKNATQHLIDKGFKKICFIGGSLEFRVNNERLKGYTDSMVKNNIDVSDYMIFTNDDSEETGMKGMQQFLKYFVPDAIVTTDDLIAFGACQKGFETIGEYIPVVGFNNTPVSVYRNPQFSSVEIFAEKLGYHSAKTLIHLLEEKEVLEKHFTVATKFYDRT